jgi:PAS domain-containing protein
MAEQRQAATPSTRRDVPPMSPVGLVMVDRQLRLIDVNHALAALDETRAAGPLRRDVRDVLPAGLAEEVVGQVRHVLATGRPVTGAEYELLPAGTGQPGTGQPGTGQPETGQPETGQPRWWRASYFAVRAGAPRPADAGAGDPVVGVGAVIEDITEHRAAERRAAQQQQFLLSISAAVLHGEKSVEEIARKLVDHLIRDVADGCAIWLYTSDRAHLQAAAVAHRNPRKAEWLRAEVGAPLPVTDDDLLAEAIRRQRMIVIDDVAAGPTRPAVHPWFSAVAERTGCRRCAWCRWPSTMRRWAPSSWDATDPRAVSTSRIRRCLRRSPTGRRWR